MSFLQPQYLKLFLLLIALLPLWLYYLGTKHRTRQSLGVSLPLRKISHLSSLGRDCGRYLVLNLVLSCLILALAHPRLIREKMVPEPRKMDIVFLLDTSPSMRAHDMPPSRLERALEVIGAFSLRKLRHDRLGLVSFSEGSLILSYLTEDPDNILYYLDYLRNETTPSFGTNIGRALINGLTIIAKDLEANPEAVNEKRIFILLSDGEDHGAELQKAVEEIKRRGVKIHTIGIGSKEGAPIPIAWKDGELSYLEDQAGKRILSFFDARTLRWIAEETGGNAYRSLTGQELEKIFAEIVMKERDIRGFKRVVEYEDIYHRFLLLALGIFLPALLI